jgi:hypothetical protein
MKKKSARWEITWKIVSRLYFTIFCYILFRSNEKTNIQKFKVNYESKEHNLI